MGIDWIIVVCIWRNLLLEYTLFDNIAVFVLYGLFIDNVYIVSLVSIR